ncbi:MAG: PKD domain-containing protein [Planctomycetota bacterium]|nr:PKD domain-containing protein [Planctomycetota bacterium]
MLLRSALLLLVIGVFAFTPAGPGWTANLPVGFVETTVGSGWNQVAGLTFDADGRMFVWERGGKVWIVEDGVKKPQPFLDISEEVGGWRDYGLLGFALHPDFAHTGHVYLLYVVDHHHLTKFGTSQYDAGANEYFQATIGRITRYTAQLPPGADHYDHAITVDYASRKVLLGESIDKGFPILHQSHGVGTIVFGTDGTLLASCGDGASYSGVDTGGPQGSQGTGSYYAQGLAEGIISTKEDVGSYRSQLLDSLNGKVVRIDPETGDGIPSNPFYDGSKPRSARSRVWSLGLRNPFRMCLRPGTGSHFASAGDPGTLYIGDVGWGTWEELNVAKGGGDNFGWPAFEGMEAHSGYWSEEVANLDAPNPLAAAAGCAQDHFYFRDLIQQATLAPNPTWPNPCDPGDQVPATLDRFLHARPAIDWRHGGNGYARTATWNGQNAAFVRLDDAASPVPGPKFGGNCSVAGVWYTGTQFPPEFQNVYFHADYAMGWIKAFRFDGNDDPVEVKDFISNAGSVVAMATCPTDGCLYYVAWSQQIRKVSYVSQGNQPPVAVATANVTYGPGPLAVQFTGENSSDPEGDDLTYHWHFGDGSGTHHHTHMANPLHTFDAPVGVPTAYTVELTVTDGGGKKSSTELLISVNNTPPVVDITSVPALNSYTVDQGDIVVPLQAAVTDAEHGPGQLTYAWQTFLHHNTHNHPEPIDTEPVTSTTISPIGCNGETYYYRIRLEVTDGAGLKGFDEVLYVPDCGGFGGDFENGVGGWTTTGLWHVVEDGTGCGDARGGTKSMYYGSDATCSYDVGTTTGTLTSPPIRVDVGGSPRLSFHHRFETESFDAGSYDQLHVELYDGARWIGLQSWDSTVPNVTQWTKQEYDLSAYAGRSIRVRFRFDSLDDQFNAYQGWYVDDVVFSGLAALPQPPTAEFTATPLVGAAPLQVQFTDTSVDNPTSWAWDFDDDGTIDSTEQNPVHTYTAPGTYTVRLTATNELGSGEEVKPGLVFVADAASDWTDDMESGDGAWTATGLWHRVTDASCGVAAFSGVGQWYFGDDASCTYATGSQATGALTSPPLVLSADASVLRFHHQFETEDYAGPFDQCFVEIDDGSGWTELRSWDSSSPNVAAWTEELIDLAPYAGKTVRIRFRFDSVDDLFNAFRGWNIDDVTVTNVLAP